MLSTLYFTGIFFSGLAIVSKIPVILLLTLELLKSVEIKLNTKVNEFICYIFHQLMYLLFFLIRIREGRFENYEVVSSFRIITNTSL